MNNDRNLRLQTALREVAAEFLAREAGRQSLITVTEARLSEDGKSATIYITVFPETSEEYAVAFANRNRKEFASFFQKRVKRSMLPKLEFMIDKGEKMRQRLDELS